MLVLLGPPGTGKTYLCAALIEALYDSVISRGSFRAYKEDNLLKRLRESIADGHGDYMQHLQYLIDDYLIVLDDMGCSGHTQWREEVFTGAISYRYESRLPTVITTNLTVQEIREKYHARIESRLFASENTIINLKGMVDLRLFDK